MSTYPRYNLGDELQSATKESRTSLIKAKRDCDDSLNCGNAVVLIFLDLSTAFDTIDHEILLDRLLTIVGIKSRAMNWLRSYVTRRSQQVVSNSTSKCIPL